jgi:tRNA A-37 threonylcarbamoyl transferase component Bud32
MHEPLRAADLRAAGRTPALPFAVALADGRSVRIERLLRVLPGKRLVGAGTLEGESVLVKLFIASASERHWTRELNGIRALLAADVPTPALVEAQALAGGGHALLTVFVPGAEDLAAIWRDDPEERGPRLLAAAMPLLARMHAAGLRQADLHLGNFLFAGGAGYVIDGDAVSTVQPPRSLTLAERTDNLAILFAQLPPCRDARRQPFIDAYAALAAAVVPDARALQQAVEAVRARRLREFLGKIGRECTQFAVERGMKRFAVVEREASELLRDFLSRPDACLGDGVRLKSGGTCTVAEIAAGGRRLVVKRYNLKHWRHALSRVWRPSRAWHSWREAHRLGFYGIVTPRPLAVLEERLGPLRGRAFLVTEHCAGRSLLASLDPQQPPSPAMAEALQRLFTELCTLRITHGDLKASNLLWEEGRVVLIDLDAMCQHRTEAAFARAWRRDRGRFLRNWAADSPLYRWLDERLPTA